jgi:hypothetical protein
VKTRLKSAKAAEEEEEEEGIREEDLAGAAATPGVVATAPS